jgi:hypothetical protein
MAKLTVVFRDGETVSESYADEALLMQVVKFCMSGVTIKTLTIER